MMRIVVIVSIFSLALSSFARFSDAVEPKQVVIVAGLKSHGPEGNGIHDYAWSARLIKTMLETSNVKDRIRVTTHLNGWPRDKKTLDNADTVMVISDGRDGDIGREAPHLANDTRIRQVETLRKRGVGLVTFHFSTFAPDKWSTQVLDWYGGYFDWETDGRRKWYSKIETLKAVVAPASPGHQMLRGVKPFKIHEEFYYDIRFRKNDAGWSPIWIVDALPATKTNGNVVAWAVERKNGARGFATTCGHFYRNWEEPDFRKTILNGILWTAHAQVPKGGVEADFFSHEQIADHLQQPDTVASSELAEDSSSEQSYADDPYWYKPGHSVNPAAPSSIKSPPRFVVDRVYSVPEASGSWTAITTDGQGRLLCAAQHKPGIYRLTPNRDTDGGRQTQAVRVERLSDAAERVGWCHGLLYAFDSLYVTVNEENDDDTIKGGVYRLRDTDGDDQFDKVEHVVEFNIGGEHGAHNIVVGPDSEWLYMMCGNGTKLPADIQKHYPSRTGGIDHLMPPGFEDSQYTSAGFVLRFRPDGSQREVFCGGLRNSFDLAFNRHGDLFTFDSDMEWDLGAPWYRPTRICHLVKGGEFGWRGDAAKWPEYFEDSVGAVVNIGPASPSGVVFGYDTNFPETYREAFFACDWTFATIHAVHLEREGASYRARVEEFVGGNGLPVTDLTTGKDGAIYFLVGGRRLGSAVYRVRYAGEKPGISAQKPAKSESDTLSHQRHEIRKRLESLQGKSTREAMEVAWPYLSHRDRAIRFAARLVVESQPVDTWRERAIKAKNVDAKATVLLALARKDDDSRMTEVIAGLNGISLEKASDEMLLRSLRAYELALARGEDTIDQAIRVELRSRLRSLFPHKDSRVNRELIRMLCYLGDRSMIDPLLDYMEQDLGDRPVLGGGNFVRNPKYGQAVREMLLAAPLVERMHTAQMLLWLDGGWTKPQRRRYFELIADAVQNSNGGHTYEDIWNRIREVAMEQTPEGWRDALTEVAEKASSEPHLPRPQGPGEEWTMSELLDAVGKKFRGRDFSNGEKMFSAAKCISCHRFNGRGNSTGPDLSSIGQRFTLRDILDSTLHPSKAVSDQYRVTMLVTSDGRTISGRVTSRNNQRLTIATNLNRPSQTTSIALTDIEFEQLTPISTMPEGLLNSLNLEEVLDLLAYLVTGANEHHPLFEKTGDLK